MKKFLLIGAIVAIGIAISSCGGVRRNPGRAYMPDMVYSRAYETYASTEALQREGVNYNAQPVPGTVARGDLFAYPLKNDSAGYADSKNIKNPLPPLETKQFIEAARLYLVNCGICHGPKLDGNGPLFVSGVYPAAPKNFMAEDMIKLPEGTMFHSITYGKNQMGSYASQLSTLQRWMIIHYIKEKQKAASGSVTAASVADTTAKGK